MTQNISSITFDSKNVIGRGSSSVVYKGRFGQRAVAVKKIDKKNSKLIQSEILLLQKSDEHPNIIRYFVSQEDQQFTYLALELCSFTLKDYVMRNDLKSRISSKTVIEKMFGGLRWLHSLKIVHRDIKPTNVLLMEKPDGELELKISDFGFAKEIEISNSQMSIVPDESVYWKVPEMFQGKYNMKSDVFSMGCLIFYIANNGLISKTNDLVNFLWTESYKQSSDAALIKHLVTIMTNNDQQLRPSFSCLLYHPYFWSNQKILNFLVSFADRIKKNDSLAYTIKNALQQNAEKVIDSSWLTRLEPIVIESLAYRSAHHNYGGSSISELLRALRNKEAHYDEMSGAAKQMYGSLPDGYSNYWTSKFPLLVIYLYIKGQISGLSQEPNFDQYYQHINACANLRM